MEAEAATTPRHGSGEHKVRDGVEDGGGAPASKRPSNHVRGVFQVLGGERVQRWWIKEQWNGGNLQTDLALVSGEIFPRLAHRERARMLEWVEVSAGGVCVRVARREALGWLKITRR